MEKSPSNSDLNRPATKAGIWLMAIGILYFTSQELYSVLTPKKMRAQSSHTQEQEALQPSTVAPIIRKIPTTFFPPCSEKDTGYKIFHHNTYGDLCLDKHHNSDTIKSKLRKGLIWEEELFPVFEQYIDEGDVVIDVGAHIGTHSIIFSQRVGPKGLVYTFEPNFKMYQEQLVNLNLNQIANVRAEFAALGANDQRGSMGITIKGNEGHTALGIGGNIVEIRRLDSYNFNRVNFIKIDVEGAEKGVLLGAKSILKRFKPVLLIEIRQDHENVLELIKTLGYKIDKKLGEDDYLALPKNIN